MRINKEYMRGFVTYYIESNQIDQILGEIASIFREYPVQGYNTSVSSIEYDSSLNCMVAKVTRYNSCD